MILDVQHFTRKYDIRELTPRDGKRLEHPFAYTREDELRYARDGPIDYQAGYLGLRLAVREALRSIVSETLDVRSLGNGAEFGCGAYGCLANFLLPAGASLKQFDVNPQAVAMNRKFSGWLRRFRIREGSVYDMPLPDASVDSILGLSSWDSIAFFDQAIEEVDRCLKPGGRFAHYQDLMPADSPLILREARRRVGRGVEPVFNLGIVRVFQRLGPYVERQDYVSHIDTLDFGYVGLGECLTRMLAGLYEQRGYRIETAGEKQKEVLVPMRAFRKALKKHAVDLEPSHNAFWFADGQLSSDAVGDVPDGFVKQNARAQVLVAQKP